MKCREQPYLMDTEDVGRWGEELGKTNNRDWIYFWGDEVLKLDIDGDCATL